MTYYKAFIRVIKSIHVENKDNEFSSYDSGYMEHTNIIREKLIIAENKDQVKSVLLNKYPQFFPNNKVYYRETKDKDKAQFFYVLIYELYHNEIEEVKKGEWMCSQCGSKHKNTYEVPPVSHYKLVDKLFCNKQCKDEYHNNHYDGKTLFEGEEYYINSTSLNYIYKITEKSTNKCYIGKTKNEPFFRWWNHLSKSSSPFGLYLRKTKLSEWTFEVISVLPSTMEDSEVFKIESEYIHKYNSLNNGFNSVISNKKAINKYGKDLFNQ